jgi:SAM-dependent methyltransferase
MLIVDLNRKSKVANRKSRGCRLRGGEKGMELPTDQDVMQETDADARKGYDQNVRGTDPKPIALTESHAMLAGLIGQEPVGRILDAPCGRGGLSVQLRRMGFAVSCCDIDPGVFKVEGLPLTVANLNRDRLPYNDGAFDYIVSASGLHRISNLDHAIGQFARCLKPRGKLFISLPNYASLWRRLLFLLLGSFGKDIDRPTFNQTTADEEAHFRRNLTFTQLDHYLQKHGFKKVDVFKSRTEMLNLLLLPLYLVIRFVSLLCGSKVRAEYNVGRANARAILLGSHHIFVRALIVTKLENES